MFTLGVPDRKLKHYLFQGRSLVQKAVCALSDEGINKVALVVFSRNESGNAFWEHIGFEGRIDLVYRNKNIHELQRINT